MSEPIYENKKYLVNLTNQALGEDGKYGVEGYAVINRETGIIEHTTMVLPQALFQADAFMGALGQLDAVEDADETINLEDVAIDPTDIMN